MHFRKVAPASLETKAWKESYVDVMRLVKKLLQVSSRLGEEQQRRERGEVLFGKYNCQGTMME